MSEFSGPMAWMNIIETEENDGHDQGRKYTHHVTVSLNDIDPSSSARILEKSGERPDQYELNGNESQTAIEGLESNFNMNTGILVVSTADKQACNKFISALTHARVNYSYKIS